MITEMSRIDHRARISHRLKLAMIVLLSAQPVCTALGQVEPASKSVVDSVAAPVSTSTDAAQPSLEELMVRFAEFEKAYWPFRVKSRQTYRTKEPLPTDPNAPLQPANKIELVETAQLDKLIWFNTVDTIIGDKSEEFDRRECNIEGVQNLSLRGALSNSFEAHGRHPLNCAPAVPLMGVFPIRMHDASDGLLLSEYYQKIPASCMLSWDGKLAKIEFNIMAPILDASRSFFFDEADDEDEVFGENGDRRFTPNERYQVWLDPDQQWHPSRLRRSYASTLEVLIEDWEVTQFRQGTGIDPRISEGTIHRRAPVDHHIDFVIENSAYGEHVDPTHFHVKAKLPVTDAPSTEKSTNELQDEYTKHEQATQELATRLKTITSEFGKDHPATEKRRVELRMAVHQSFKLRQELQRAELADFARRMKKLQQSIDARDRIADRIVERRLKELQDPTLNGEATESMNESKSSEKAVTDIDTGIAVADDNRQPPTSDAETAIARLVIVFFQDQARRAVPGLMIDRGTETLVLTTGPATIVPDGVPHAKDRAFLEFPGEADVEAAPLDTRTPDLFFHRAKPGLTKFQIGKPVALAIGDSLSAILLTGQKEPGVTLNAARITALDQATTFALESQKFRHEFSGLVEIDQRLPEGTPLFKNGQLAGIVLLGTRFLSNDFTSHSLVVPSERIIEVLGQISEQNE